VNEETDISNVLEPESLELLRLCFWINRSKQIITDKKSFEIKFIEVRNSLGFQDETEFKEQLYRKPAFEFKSSWKGAITFKYV
jgi:hypothetical protein